MATITDFRELNIWQEAREISREVHGLTSKGTFSRDFEIKNQINRSAGSIADNIAEGFERGGNKEFIYFLGIAKGSIGELQSQLFRATDQGHIDEETANKLFERCKMLATKIGALIKYLKHAGIKGIRFK